MHSIHGTKPETERIDGRETKRMCTESELVGKNLYEIMTLSARLRWNESGIHIFQMSQVNEAARE